MRLDITQVLALPGPKIVAAWSWLRSTSEPWITRLRSAVNPYWQQAAEWYAKREAREKVL